MKKTLEILFLEIVMARREKTKDSLASIWSIDLSERGLFLKEFAFSTRAINRSRILKSGNSIYKRLILDVPL